MKIPDIPQSSTTEPEVVGCHYAADVFKYKGQNILVIRKHISSYTAALLVENKTATVLASALTEFTSLLKCPAMNVITVRTDNAPAFSSLVKTEALKTYGIVIELGHSKFINKNPVGEQAVQDVENEIRNLHIGMTKLTPAQLAIAVSHVNTKIRGSGLSASKIWHRRDQFSRQPILVDDKQLIQKKIESRSKNHQPSTKSKGSGKNGQDFSVGALVYRIREGTKLDDSQRYEK